jgi:putative nucleotidyltransferase with HDIG domain
MSYIPTEVQCRKLWQKYNMPEEKKRHLEMVAKITDILVRELRIKNEELRINGKLLFAAALLHDIDKNAEKLPGERHPDTAVRILMEEGMPDVAEVVKSHSLHTIVDPKLSPKTWEEKILFLADKMVKIDFIGVDERFNLWNAEHLPIDAQNTLDLAYPKVKHLEHEVLESLNINSDDFVKYIQKCILNQSKE